LAWTPTSRSQAWRGTGLRLTSPPSTISSLAGLLETPGAQPWGALVLLVAVRHWMCLTTSPVAPTPPRTSSREVPGGQGLRRAGVPLGATETHPPVRGTVGVTGIRFACWAAALECRVYNVPL
jgi:proline-rich tail region repeat protein